MALVGDMIFRTRAKIPDLPMGFIPPPSSFVGHGNTDPNFLFNYLLPGTYYAVACWLTNWGISLPSPEASILVNPSNNTIVTDVGMDPFTASFPAGVIGYRVYIGTTPGGESYFMDSTTGNFYGNITTTTFTAGPTLSPGTPPTRSTAYVMDSDGKMFGASTLYDWLNDALVSISRGVGGILDYSGVPTVSGQSLYVLPGEWMEISDVWYGGYWVQGGKRGDFFKRNTVSTQILNNVTISVFGGKQVMEVSYQPDRTAGVTTTTVGMNSATDQGVPVANPGVFLLPFGFAQISSNPSVQHLLPSEIVAYANTAMGGLVRGLGATGAQVWPSGSVVTELPLFWCGKRLYQSGFYVQGQSFLPLDIPTGWDSIVPMYMLGLAKDAELDVKTGAEMKKEAVKLAIDFMTANRGVTRFVQVGGYGATNTITTYNNTVAGGVIVP